MELRNSTAAAKYKSFTVVRGLLVVVAGSCASGQRNGREPEETWLQGR